MMTPSGTTVYKKMRCHNRQQACVDYLSQYLSLTVPKTHILYGAITKRPCWRTLSINFNKNLPPTLRLHMRFLKIWGCGSWNKFFVAKESLYNHSLECLCLQILLGTPYLCFVGGNWIMTVPSLHKESPVKNLCLTKANKNFDSTIVSAMNVVNISRTFFLQSAGGCGKIFVLNLLLPYVRSQGHIALAMATSGSASLLLDRGTTAHSRMGIPTAIGGYSGTSKQSERAAIIREANSIISDEAPMAHKDALRVVDELLRSHG